MKYDNRQLTKEQIQEAVSNTKSMAAAARYLNVSRGKFKKYAVMYNLFEPNQSGKGTLKYRIYTNEEIFTNNTREVSSTTLITRLKEIREWKCECCGSVEWMGQPLTLEIHHIDGNRQNNNLNNLQILCPNCHSLTDNWRSRNIKGYNKSKPKVSDEVLLETLNKHKNIFSALQELGLAGGSNYKRAYKLLLKYVKNDSI